MQKPTINNLDYKSMGQDDQCVGPRDEGEMGNLHVLDFLDAHWGAGLYFMLYYTLMLEFDHLAPHKRLLHTVSQAQDS